MTGVQARPLRSRLRLSRVRVSPSGRREAPMLNPSVTGGGGLVMRTDCGCAPAVVAAKTARNAARPGIRGSSLFIASHPVHRILLTKEESKQAASGANRRQSFEVKGAVNSMHDEPVVLLQTGGGHSKGMLTQGVGNIRECGSRRTCGLQVDRRIANPSQSDCTVPVHDGADVDAANEVARSGGLNVEKVEIDASAGGGKMLEQQARGGDGPAQVFGGRSPDEQSRAIGADHAIGDKGERVPQGRGGTICLGRLGYI